MILTVTAGVVLMLLDALVSGAEIGKKKELKQIESEPENEEWPV